MRLRFWAIAAVAMAASAAHADARRVLLIVNDAQELDLAGRIAGQVADLDVAIVIATASLPPDLDGQLAQARARAGEQRAEAVVWLCVSGGDWLIGAAQGDRVVTRRLARASGVLSRSASIEAVALAVRTDLKGLATRAAIEKDAAPRPPAPLRPWIELGWAGVLEGGTASGHQGVAARLGAAFGRWRAAAALAYYPAATLSSPLATIRLERQELGLVAGVDLLGLPRSKTRFRLGLEIGLEAVRFPRTTTLAGTDLKPTGSADPWSPAIAPLIRLAYRFTPTFWLAFSLGTDLLMRPPEFDVANGTGFERVSALRVVAPRGTLSLTFDPF